MIYTTDFASKGKFAAPASYTTAMISKRKPSLIAKNNPEFRNHPSAHAEMYARVLYSEYRSDMHWCKKGKLSAFSVTLETNCVERTFQIDPIVCDLYCNQAMQFITNVK